MSHTKNQSPRSRTIINPTHIDPTYTHYSSRYILGQRVDYTNYTEASEKVLAMAREGQAGYVCISTVHMVIEGYDDPEFRRIVNGVDLATLDGIPLVWGVKTVGDIFIVA